MLAQVERLGRLVDQLLDLLAARVGRGPAPDRGPAAQPLVDDLISGIDVALAGRGVDVRNDVADLPALSADRERVHQVLFNLVDNAVRFTPDGGGVTIGPAPERLGRGRRRRHRRRDRRGASPRLFERFYRADAARTRGEGGPGSGSRCARSVVEAHGGRISAESEPGHGSVFTFDLPSADGGTA